MLIGLRKLSLLDRNTSSIKTAKVMKKIKNKLLKTLKYVFSFWPAEKFCKRFKSPLFTCKWNPRTRPEFKLIFGFLADSGYLRGTDC